MLKLAVFNSSKYSFNKKSRVLNRATLNPLTYFKKLKFFDESATIFLWPRERGAKKQKLSYHCFLAILSLLDNG